MHPGFTLILPCLSSSSSPCLCSPHANAGTPHTCRATMESSTASVCACGSRPDLAHPSQGSCHIRRSAYGPSGCVRMRSPANFGIAITRVVPQKGVHLAAPSGVRVCGPQSISAHSSNGSCPSTELHSRPQWGCARAVPGRFQHTPRTDHAPLRSSTRGPSGGARVRYSGSPCQETPCFLPGYPGFPHFARFYNERPWAPTPQTGRNPGNPGIPGLGFLWPRSHCTQHISAVPSLGSCLIGSSVPRRGTTAYRRGDGA